MSRRSYIEKLERYNFKIRRLQENETKRRQRIIDSSDSDNPENEPQPALGNVLPTESLPEVTDGDLPHDKVLDENSRETSPIPGLDPDILSGLSEAVEDAPKFGEKIHDNLARLCLPILRRGIEKEAKEKLMKEYQIPENCTLLQAPKLNLESPATISDITKNMDKRLESAHQQLGLGITALNKGLSLLLENGLERVKAVELLNDSCRILCDLHHVETEIRKNIMTPGLNKAFLNLIEDEDRDDTIPCQNHSEEIKTSKAIEKHRLRIKQPASVKKAVSSTQPSTSGVVSQANSSGASRSGSKAQQVTTTKQQTSSSHPHQSQSTSRQNLSEEIKSSKAIEKHRLRIKQTSSIKKAVSSTQPSTSGVVSQANSSGPSRSGSKAQQVTTTKQQTSSSHPHQSQSTSRHNLSEEIKSSKTIEKHRLHIKQPASIKKAVSSIQPSTSAVESQANSSGPSRSGSKAQQVTTTKQQTSSSHPHQSQSTSRHNLSEEIKSSKAIEKHRLRIKQPVSVKKAVSSTQPSTSGVVTQANSSGPSQSDSKAQQVTTTKQQTSSSHPHESQSTSRAPAHQQ